MSVFDAYAAQADTAEFALFGELGTYTPIDGSPAFSCYGVHTAGGQAMPGAGFSFQLAEAADTWSFRKSDVPQPKRGDTFTVGATTYRIADGEPVSQDGWLVTLRVL